MCAPGCVRNAQDLVAIKGVIAARRSFGHAEQHLANIAATMTVDRDAELLAAATPTDPVCACVTPQRL